MEFCLLGVNYSRTPVTVRDKVAIGIGRLEDALLVLRNYAVEGIILATCNRLEVFTFCDKDNHAELATIDFLKTRTGLKLGELLPYLYIHQNGEAVKHLFSVASGLDSMLIGEYEVLGQISRALEEAEKQQMVGLALGTLFRQAIGTGRRVRQETKISQSALSVSSVAVEMAANAVGDFRGTKVLVIGAGEAGRLVAKSAKEKGADEIIVASRNQEKAAATAEVLGGKPFPMDKLDQALTIPDIIISCTSAPHFILKYDRVVKAMSTRSGHRLVIIDIAVPRDVEPRVKEIGNVFLYDLDDFNKIAETNRQLRQAEIQRAMKIVDNEVSRFNAWWQAMTVRPTVSALVQKADSIRQAQFERTLRRLPGISDEEKTSLEVMTKAIVQRILHEPIQHLRDSDHQTDDYIRMINELFGLDSKEENTEE